MRTNFSELSDGEVISGLQTLCANGRRVLAGTLSYLAEIEERRIHLKMACSSMFDFCTRRFGMSEGEAFRRISAARLVRRFPDLLPRIERGEIHLSALVLLRERLTESNWRELVAEAAGKSKREVQELVAKRFPRPDVRAMIRKLPPRQVAAPLQPIVTPPSSAVSEPPGESSPETPPPETTARQVVRLAPAQVAPREKEAPLIPLSPDRYKLQLTASAELGKTSRPQRRPRPTQPGRITRATRREVFARDGEQCTFRDAAGNRCPSRSLLELDHVDPRARGGRKRCHQSARPLSQAQSFVRGAVLRPRSRRASHSSPQASSLGHVATFASSSTSPAVSRAQFNEPHGLT